MGVCRNVYGSRLFTWKFYPEFKSSEVQVVIEHTLKSVHDSYAMPRDDTYNQKVQVVL